MYLGSDAEHMISTFTNATQDSAGIGWTPRKLGVGFYGVTVEDIKAFYGVSPPPLPHTASNNPTYDRNPTLQVAGVSLGLPPTVYNTGDAIVDSGTSDFNLPSSAMKSLKSGFAALCATHCLKGVCDCKAKTPLQRPIFESRCVSMEPADILLFPTIAVDFEGGLTIPYLPENCLRNGSQFCNGDPKQYSIAIESGGKDGSGTIFGDTFMRGYNVIHDRRKPQRIGFAKVPRGGACP
jgi:hypothetical protein